MHNYLKMPVRWSVGADVRDVRVPVRTLNAMSLNHVRASGSFL